MLTFTSGQSAQAGKNLQCINLTLLNDPASGNNRTLVLTLNSTQQDANVVRISSVQQELILTITNVLTTSK